MTEEPKKSGKRKFRKDKRMSLGLPLLLFVFVSSNENSLG